MFPNETSTMLLIFSRFDVVAQGRFKLFPFEYPVSRIGKLQDVVFQLIQNKLKNAEEPTCTPNQSRKQPNYTYTPKTQ